MEIDNLKQKILLKKTTNALCVLLLAEMVFAHILLYQEKKMGALMNSPTH
jgi:hypothetical protein